jgi:hypothetical protein
VSIWEVFSNVGFCSEYLKIRRGYARFGFESYIIEAEMASIYDFARWGLVLMHPRTGSGFFSIEEYNMDVFPSQ